jgi:hypothetical protein
LKIRHKILILFVVLAVFFIIARTANYIIGWPEMLLVAMVFTVIFKRRQIMSWLRKVHAQGYRASTDN